MSIEFEIPTEIPTYNYVHLRAAFELRNALTAPDIAVHGPDGDSVTGLLEAIYEGRCDEVHEARIAESGVESTGLHPLHDVFDTRALAILGVATVLRAPYTESPDQDTILAMENGLNQQRTARHYTHLEFGSTGIASRAAKLDGYLRNRPGESMILLGTNRLLAAAAGHYANLATASARITPTR